MSASLSQVLGRLGSPRFLVVGDLLLDRYLTGAVDRISPEAPIQVLRVESSDERFGGAGAVAHNLTVLGGRTRLLGVVGSDRAAERMHALAHECGFELEAVPDPARRTSVKTRHLAHSHTFNQQVLRVDEESTEPLAGTTELAVLERARGQLGDVDCVLLSDYGKGVVTERVAQGIITAAREVGIPVLVDSKRADLGRFRGATAITPNRPETARATGIEIHALEAAERAATKLIDAVELDFALITLDKEGMYLKERAGSAAGVHLPITPREVFDVTGAGDMVVSVLAFGIASGVRPYDSAALANVAAGLAVERVGAVPITREEIQARLVHEGRSSSAKRIDATELEALGERLRAAKRRIVFTNGCFDILHAGHVRYLSEAKRLGDVLVVGVNSDDSVERLKGPERPLNGLEDRLEVLCGLAVVDHVVSFADDVPVPLVEALRPDVLVKGADYRDKVVEGRDIVEAYGGKVVLVDLLEGRSTTGLVEKIREQE